MGELAHCVEKRQNWFRHGGCRYDRMGRVSVLTTPGTVLDNRELLSFMMPALRADFPNVGTSEYEGAEPLGCPICVLNGESDQAAAPAGLDAWAECTVSRASVTTMPGRHFFVQEHPELVQAFMRKSLRHSSAVA